MQNMPIGIFRGDDTDAFSYQTIVGTINTDLDLTGCKAVFRYLGFSMDFDPIPEDRKLTIVIPADETKKFPPGLGYASLRVYDSDGRLKTFSNRIMVFVATKTPMFGSDEFEVDFNVRATLEPLKFFVGPNPDDFDEYRGYVEKVIDRASAEKYGLAILLDAIDSDLGAADGVAATPVAVKAAYAAIIDKLTDDYYTAEETDEAIDRVAAYYITYDAAGNPFPTYAALANAQTVYSGGQVRTPTRNDYCVVLADETHDNAEYRYIYAVADGETTGSWQPQFPVEGVMTVDPTVTRNSQNPVASSGVWSAIWGALTALPTGFSSLYDWVVAQLGLKRDYTDLSYDTTETVEVPALHSVMTAGGQTLAEYDLLCAEEVPDPPQIGHTYTWRADGAAFYVTQGVSALQTTWILYSQNGESLDGVTTQNATQGFYPDLDFRPSGAVITIHKTTAQKTVTVEDELALKSDIPAPSTATPAMDGTGAAGTSAAFARGDHVHPTDTSRMAATATGADIAVSGTDATKIDAALAGKASKSDATLTERFSEWDTTTDMSPTEFLKILILYGDADGTTGWYPLVIRVCSAQIDDIDALRLEYAASYNALGVPVVATRQTTQSAWILEYDYEGWYHHIGIYWKNGYGWCIGASDHSYDGDPKGSVDSTELSWTDDWTGASNSYTLTATRTALSGYQLGSQDGKPLASEAEAEALRQGKLDKSGGTMTGPLHMGDNFLKWQDGNLIYWLSTNGLYIWDDGDDVTHSPTHIIEFPLVSGTLALAAANPTAGNLAALDASGNPTDSGKKPSDFATAAQGAKADAALSRAEAEAGFTEWVYSDNLIHHLSIADASAGWIYIMDGSLDSSEIFTSQAQALAAVSLTFPLSEEPYITATRTRLPTMADVNAKASKADNPTAGNLAALDASGNPTDSTIPAANVALKGDIPYDRITITTGQLQDRAVQKVSLSAASTTLTLPALTDLTGKVSDFGIDMVNGYAPEVGGTPTPTAASFSLAGTLGRDYNIIVPKGEDWSEMTALAAGEMAQFYFTLSSFQLDSKLTWKVVKQVVQKVTIPTVTP